MTAAAVRIVVEDALKRMGASRDVVPVIGSQLMAEDSEKLACEFDLKHIRIRMWSAESARILR